MKNIIVGIVLFTCSMGAFSANWQRVSTGQDESKIYIDADSRIYSAKNNTVIVWIKGEGYYKPARLSYESAEESYKQKIIYFCSTGKSQTLYHLAYDESGNVINSSRRNKASEPTDVVPDTIGEDLYAAICSNPKKGLKIKNEPKFYEELDSLLLK